MTLYVIEITKTARFFSLLMQPTFDGNRYNISLDSLRSICYGYPFLANADYLTGVAHLMLGLDMG